MHGDEKMKRVTSGVMTYNQGIRERTGVTTQVMTNEEGDRLMKGVTSTVMTELIECHERQSYPGVRLWAEQIKEDRWGQKEFASLSCLQKEEFHRKI